MLQLTNESLLLNRKKAMMMGELLAFFFGVMILATRHELTSWASLWSTVSALKYTTAAAFGKTGMARARFDSIWSNLEWSRQPCVRPDGMGTKKYRWLLVDGFVIEYNQYRASNFTPSDIICVDESISRWYGQGGHWINHGLPMYITIDRKPENGCKIQNSACGWSTIMMRLKLVKTAKEEATHMVVDEEDRLLHGTKVLLLLVQPWLGTGRTVCGDSYFASVGAAKEMEKKGMGFIGVIKTATRHFPMAYLTNIEMEARGERAGVIYRDEYGIPRLMAFVWMDRDRRYFIACVVDSWLAFSQCTESSETQKDFYSLIADELIDNKDNNLLRYSARASQQQNEDDSSTISGLTSASGLPRCGVHSHLTPTKRKRRRKDGSMTTSLLQGRCVECGPKSTYLCSECVDDKIGGRKAWCCHTKNGKICYPTHVHKVHNL
jgi:hypothetical protein